MVLKWDQRRAYAAIPFISAPGITLWISLSSEAVDRLWSARVDDKSFKSQICLTHRKGTCYYDGGYKCCARSSVDRARASFKIPYWKSLRRGVVHSIILPMSV